MWWYSHRCQMDWLLSGGGNVKLLNLSPTVAKNELITFALSSSVRAKDPSSLHMGCISLSPVRTMKFSKVVASSSSSVVTSAWWHRVRLLRKKAISLWKRSSGRSSAAKCKSARSRKWALVIWKPKSARTMFQTDYMDSSLRYSEILLDNNWLFARAWAPENWLSAGPCGVWREVLGSLSMQRFWGTDGNRKWTFRRPEQCSFPDFQTSGLYY